MSRYNLNAGFGQVLGQLPYQGTGKVFVVGKSTVANIGMLKDLFGYDPDGTLRYFATIDSAIGACTANANDLILVMPGHTETITAAAGIVCDVAGVTILGLGNARNRPIITFTTSTGADVDIDAANVTMKGLGFVCNIANQTAMIDVNSTGFTLEDCVFTDGSASALTMVDVNGGGANACDAFVARGNSFYSLSGANTADRAIELGEVAAQCIIEKNSFDGDFDDAAVHNPTGKVLTNLTISGNKAINRQTGQHAIELVSACTGMSSDNRFVTDSQLTAYDAGALNSIEDYFQLLSGGDTQGVPVFSSADSQLNPIGTNSADNTYSSSSVAANADGSVLERLEYIQTAVATDSAVNWIGVDSANNTAATTLVTANADGSLLERAEYIQTDLLAHPRCIEKSDGTVTSGTDDLFVITGGPVEVLNITGIVTTGLGAGTANVKLQITTSAPAATVDMNAGAVDVDADAAGTSYRSINTTAIFTPVTAGFVMKGNAFATNDTMFLAPTGIIKLASDATLSGNIKWYLTYRPLSPSSRVTAAA